MWEMYEQKNDDEELKVEYDFFRSTFNTRFNISFHAPYTDKCSTCTNFESKINYEKNKEKRDELKVQLLGHKKRSDTFYEKLRDKKDDEIILSYDCMKNLVLPKVPDQEAYYRRQFYLYNFTVCQGDSKSVQSKENTVSYVWLENEYQKGSVQIASALHHKLTMIDWSGISTVRLFSDGCGGQNKNTTVLFMLSNWLLNEAPAHVKTVVLCFPIVGHSFIPPDRVFGNLERQLKAHTVIVNPEHYLETFKKFSTVVHLGTDCAVMDWKQASDDIMKKPNSWHFQFQKSKKISIKRNKNLTTILLKGELFYNFESGVYKPLCKRGKSLKNVQLKEVQRGVRLKEEKIKDVKRLLFLHFGERWEDIPALKYYKKLFEDTHCESPMNNDDDILDFDLVEGDEEMV